VRLDGSRDEGSEVSRGEGRTRESLVRAIARFTGAREEKSSITFEAFEAFEAIEHSSIDG
jgi:hypothetical protein